LVGAFLGELQNELALRRHHREDLAIHLEGPRVELVFDVRGIPSFCAISKLGTVREQRIVAYIEITMLRIRIAGGFTYGSFPCVLVWAGGVDHKV
jgi:hypothetical protein